jgi:tetratricopeptide (TPR) repeat protein
MRLVDAWADAEPTEEWGLPRLEYDLAQMGKEAPANQALAALITAIKSAPSRNFGYIAAALADYARSLELEADWYPAIDVYRTILRRLGGSRARLVVHCYNRLGMCFRSVNLLELAGLSFERARVLSLHRKDRAGELQAEIGKAKLAGLRGNLPLADAILQRVLARARTMALADIRSRALHELACTALRRGHYGDAAKLAFEALPLSREDASRYRILADLALAFLEMRAYEPARDAFVIVSSRAPEQWVRWTAYLNLLEIEACVQNKAAFDSYVKVLDHAPLTPELLMLFQLQLGGGLQRFDQAEVASIHLQRAHTIAVEHGMTVLLSESRRLLVDTEERVSPIVSADLMEIASALREMRAVAESDAGVV